VEYIKSTDSKRQPNRTHLMQSYSRPLHTKPAVEEFLERVLGFDYKKKHRGVIARIIDGELGIDKYSDPNTQTLVDPGMRDASYRSEADRWRLRGQIIDELFSLKRLSNDDNIALKKGGALPKGRLKSQKKAFILIGLPASGKSTIASFIAEEYGAIILDSDFAKRKLPEYNDHSYGATLVHDESIDITFGFQSGTPNKLKSLYARCIANSHNLVIPKIGQNPISIIELANALTRGSGYEVHLVLVSVPKQVAAKRAAIRFHDSNRYVPLGLIFDWYGNDPSHSYYYLRCKHHKLFSSFGVISTVSKPPMHTDIKGPSPVKRYSFLNQILQLP
jgi:hypothetical protein